MMQSVAAYSRSLSTLSDHGRQETVVLCTKEKRSSTGDIAVGRVKPGRYGDDEVGHLQHNAFEPVGFAILRIQCQYVKRIVDAG